MLRPRGGQHVAIFFSVRSSHFLRCTQHKLSSCKRCRHDAHSARGEDNIEVKVIMCYLISWSYFYKNGEIAHNAMSKDNI